MHNLITAVSFEMRRALHYQADMNRLFERPANYQSDTTRARIDSCCSRLVKYLLSSAEVPLEDEIAGTADFARQFAAQRPFDLQGRSLRFSTSRGGSSNTRAAT
jgi:hypothetical protein